MTLINVDDVNIAELLIYQQLRDNTFRADNSFVADSSKVVNLILETDIEVKSIFATQAYYDKFYELLKDKNISKLYVTSKERMQTIVGHKVHHNVMLHGIRPGETEIDKLDNHIIMLDNITSSENSFCTGCILLSFTKARSSSFWKTCVTRLYGTCQSFKNTSL